jgi:hypothetical protein
LLLSSLLLFPSDPHRHNCGTNANWAKSKCNNCLLPADYYSTHDWNDHHKNCLCESPYKFWGQAIQLNDIFRCYWCNDTRCMALSIEPAYLFVEDCTNQLDSDFVSHSFTHFDVDSFVATWDE